MIRNYHKKKWHPLLIAIICSSLSICSEDNTPQMASEQALVDMNEAQDVDYSFFNDPYLFEQYQQQKLYDLTQLNISQQSPESELTAPIVDESETSDVDFSFFNDPYAFDKFRDALPIKAKFGGYVQHSSWWDSRQSVTFGDGYIILFPKPRELDADCRDINARGEFNMSMIETRLRAEFFGPKVVGAESYAYIEGDIFGSGIVINRYRIRHAFMQLSWPTSKIMLGQFWHPMFLVKTFPLLVSFDGGSPLVPFARSPQVRYTYFHNNYELLLAATAQLQFTSNGPIGYSSTYLRNSRLPMLTARAAYDTERVYAGGDISFLRLKPRLESNKGFRVNESINSMQIGGFATVKFDPLEIRQQITYAQNGNFLTLLSGFAVTSVNPTTDERTYTNTGVFAYWCDLNINRQIEPGLFIGFGKNLGANKDIIQCIIDPLTGQEERTLYEFDEDSARMDTYLKVAPRVRFHVLPVDFAAEVEYTRCGFGCINNRARIENVEHVANTRLIFTAYYYF